MPDLKFQQLTGAAPISTDILPFVSDPGGTPLDRKSTFAQALAAASGVAGPASATDNAIARFDGTTGKLLQDSGVIVNDTIATIATFGGGTTLALSQEVSGGIPSILIVNGAALTGLTAGEEFEDITFNLDRTVTWATGDLGTQRFFAVNSGAALAFAGASNVNMAIGSSFVGLPTEGSNATIFTSVLASFEGGLSSAGDGWGILIRPLGLANGVTTASSLFNMNFTNSGEVVSLGDQNR